MAYFVYFQVLQLILCIFVCEEVDEPGFEMTHFKYNSTLLYMGYSTEHGYIYAEIYINDQEKTLKKVFMISFDNGKSFHKISPKIVESSTGITDLDINKKHFVAYSKLSKTYYWSTNGKVYLNQNQLNDLPSEIQLIDLDDDKFILMVKSAKNNFYTIREGVEKFISANVGRFLWQYGVIPTLYFTFQVKNSQSLIKYDLNSEKLIVLETQVISFKIWNGLLFVCFNLTKRGKEKTKLVIYDKQNRRNEAKFPSLLESNQFHIVRVQDNVIYCTSFSKPSKESMFLYMGVVDEYEFVKILNIYHDLSEAFYNFDVFIWKELPGVLIANTYGDIGGKNTLVTKISFNYGSTWNMINVKNFRNDDSIFSCQSPNCYARFNLYVGFDNEEEIARSDSSPNFMAATGTLFYGSDIHQVGVFITRDGGSSWEIAQVGSFAIFSLDHSGVILLIRKGMQKSGSETKHTVEISSSYDEGRTWIVIKQLMNHIYHFGIPPTRSTDLAINILSFNTVDNMFSSLHIDFSNVLKERCSIKHMIHWMPKFETRSECFHGSKIFFSIRRSDAVCYFLNDDYEYFTHSSKCECTVSDLICSFGYTRVKGECQADELHEKNSLDMTRCKPGEYLIARKPYRILPMDQCIVNDEKEKSILSQVKYCGISVDTTSVLVYSHHSTYIITNDRKTFVETPLKIDFQGYSYSIDVMNQCIYSIKHHHVMKKCFLYQRDLEISEEILSSALFIHQLRFDWIGKNLFFVSNEGISVMSIKKRHKKMLLHEKDIKSFKIYPNKGIILFLTRDFKLKKCLMDCKSCAVLATKIKPIHYAIEESESILSYSDGEQIIYESAQQKEIKREVLPSTLVDMEYFDKKLIKAFSNGVILEGYHRLADVWKLEVLNQKVIKTECHCSHICMFTDPGTFECECPQEYQLNQDLLNCMCANQTCSACSSHEFSCFDDSSCISKAWVCNGVWDCSDGSDEKDCIKTCVINEFLCKHTLECVPASDYCSGIDICSDKSDRFDCPVMRISNCSLSDFSCRNGKCISKDKVCNKKNDCGDYSDEEECLNCNLQEFACEDGFMCIPLSKRCDRVLDCEDHSDEKNCPISHWVIDHSILENQGYMNCYDDKDDINAPKKSIHISEICDHFVDCDNQLDESICDYKHYCPNQTIPCSYSRGCYHLIQKCDGVSDCADFSDEDCEVHQCLSGHGFRCSDGSCIDENKFCNGFQDCTDSSDEYDDCGSTNVITMLLAIKQDQHSLFIQYELLRNPESEEKMYFMINSSTSPGVENVFAVSKKMGFYNTSYKFSSCQEYQIIAWHSSSPNFKRVFEFTSTYIPDVPKNMALINLRLVWSYNRDYCSPINFYVLCVSNDQRPDHRNFTTDYFYDLPKGRQFKNCRVAFCPIMAFNISCGLFSSEIDMYRQISLFLRVTTSVVFIVIIMMAVYTQLYHPTVIRSAFEQIVSKTALLCTSICRVYINVVSTIRTKVEDEEGLPLLEDSTSFVENPPFSTNIMM